MKQYDIQEVRPFAGKRRFTVLKEHSDLTDLRLISILSKVGIIAGLIFYRRLTVGLVLLALAAKYYVRSGEVYVKGGTPRSPQTLSKENKKENLKKWMQKWQCDIFFFLFSMGITKEAESFPQNPALNNEKIDLKIGEEVKTYSRSFSEKIPYFEALLRSGMIEISHVEGENRSIHLTAVFFFSHEQLAAFAKPSEDLRAWGSSLEAFSCLCVEQEEEQKSVFHRLGHLQHALLSRESETLNPYLNNPRLQRLLEVPPGIKAGSYTFKLFPIGTEADELARVEDVTERSQAVVKYLNGLKEMPKKKKHYLFNKVINELLEFLHTQKKDDIGVLLAIFEKCPECKEFVTVLNLNQKTNYDRLGELLVELPNLLWLKMDIFDKKCSVDGFPLLENLRVLSINDQSFSIDEESKLKGKVPNVDVLEIQVSRPIS